MKKTESTNEKMDIKKLLLSKENVFLKQDEIYNLIKKDFRKKLDRRALKLLPLNISISNKTTSNNSPKIISPKRRVKKSLIPIPPKAIGSIQNLTLKNNNIPQTLIRSLSFTKQKRNYSIDSSLLDDNIYSSLDTKISLDKLVKLRTSFFNNQPLTKGELTEMMFGKSIPYYQSKNFTDDYQKKIMEVLSNRPQLLINLIENHKVTRSEVIDYFNLHALKLSWNENLEKKYREIVYFKNKTNSNILKTTFFLVNIGFHKILREKFEEKHLVTSKNYSQKEIDEFAIIYDKIKKIKLNVLLNGYSKIEMIYHIRDQLIHNKISKIRNEFFERKVIKFRKGRNKSEDRLFKINEETKNNLADLAKDLFYLEKIIKKFPENKTCNLGYSKQINKLNECIHDKSDYKNIIKVDKIKKSKTYHRKLIKKLQKEKLLPKKNELIQFLWEKFYHKSFQNKKIIKYLITLIQSNFRGYIIKKWFNKIQKSVKIIQKNLGKYLDSKKMVMSLFKLAVDEIKQFDKFNPEIYRAPARRIRQIIHALLRNFPSHSFFMFNKDIKAINFLYDNKLYPKRILIGNIVRSHKLLIFLDNCLFKLYHKNEK